MKVAFLAADSGWLWKSSTSARLNAGRSSGLRLVTREPSRTTSSSTHVSRPGFECGREDLNLHEPKLTGS